MEKLGEGGMGEVWRARHQLLARPCAVKLIRPELLGEGNREAVIERFQLEARTIARLSSPNTVKLYDFGVSETGSLYFVMELLDGMDLASLVQRFGPLPPERVVTVLGRPADRSARPTPRACSTGTSSPPSSSAGSAWTSTSSRCWTSVSSSRCGAEAPTSARTGP
jgi:serine/threonine-protein kinase